MTEQVAGKKVEIILCTSGKESMYSCRVDGKLHHPETSAVQNKSDQEAEGRAGSLWELHAQHPEPTGTFTEAPGQGTGHRNPADQGCLWEGGPGGQGTMTNHALEGKPQQHGERGAARKVKDGNSFALWEAKHHLLCSSGWSPEGGLRGPRAVCICAWNRGGNSQGCGGAPGVPPSKCRRTIAGTLAR